MTNSGYNIWLMMVNDSEWWFMGYWMCFQSHGGTPIAGWFTRENRTKMDDGWWLGVPLISGILHMSLEKLLNPSAWNKILEMNNINDCKFVFFCWVMSSWDIYPPVISKGIVLSGLWGCPRLSFVWEAGDRRCSEFPAIPWLLTAWYLDGRFIC